MKVRQCFRIRQLLGWSECAHMCPPSHPGKQGGNCIGCTQCAFTCAPTVRAPWWGDLCVSPELAELEQQKKRVLKHPLQEGCCMAQDYQAWHFVASMSALTSSSRLLGWIWARAAQATSLTGARRAPSASPRLCSKPAPLPSCARNQHHSPAVLEASTSPLVGLATSTSPQSCSNCTTP